MVLAVLAFCLLATIGAAMWSVARMAAVTAAEDGVRLAAAAQDPTPGNAGKPYPAAAAGASNIVIDQLRSAMPATKVTFRTAGCPPVSPLPSDIEVCSTATHKPAVAAFPGGYWVVEVRVYGCVRAIVPTFGVLGCADGIPVNVVATGHGLVFQR